MSSEKEYSYEVLQQMRKLGLAKPAEVSIEAWETATPEPTQSEVHRKLAAALENSTAGDKTAYGVMFPLAMQRVMRMLESETTSERALVALAQWIGEMHTGKAQQTVEYKGSLELEMRKLAKEMRDVESQYKLLNATTPAVLDKTDEAVNAFLESRVGTDFKVGQRGEES